MDWSTWRFPALNDARAQTAEALVALARNGEPEAAAKALGIPRTLVGELGTDAALFDAPVMPAVDRYTGVLYDALDAASLPTDARRRLGRSVAIHSAVFGPIGALDRIPDYRMSASSRIPGLRLRALWAPVVQAALRDVPGPIIDLRSESYVALGPVSTPKALRDDTAYVRVMTEGVDGVRRALNHFNKHAKGELVRRFALDGPRVRGVGDFVDWACGAGLRMESAGDREVRLLVD